MGSLTATSMTLASLCNAIETQLADVSGLYTQSYDELTEGIPQMPMVQVYPVRGELRGETGQHTFQALVRINDVTIYADVYVHTRVNLATDMKAVVEMHDLITDEFDTQKTGLPFGLNGCNAFTYTWEYAAFTYAGKQFAGLRYVMQFETY